MEETEHKVDKSEWPRGPWDHEPDKVIWKHDGFDCMIVRNSLGNLCGYVGVKEGHPWFGKDYNDVDAEVHGGLTYSDYCAGHICHPDDESGGKTFWLGFDCAHLGDLVPGLRSYMDSPRGFGPYGQDDYKDIRYVSSETEGLARQAKEAMPKKRRYVDLSGGE